MNCLMRACCATLVLLAGSALPFSASGQTSGFPEVKLTVSDLNQTAGFGANVAISGDTLVGGVQDVGSFGAAYVFVRNGTGWTRQARLTASDRTLGDLFGSSVAISGDTIVVGARGNQTRTGSAYVFVRDGAAWIEQAKLTASDRALWNSFGNSVGFSGNTIVVAAEDADSGLGAAYIFVRSGNTWTQQAKLIASNPSTSSRFGYSVAISGDTTIVGARAADDARGDAHIFVRTGDVWTQQAKLIASDRARNQLFGQSVAIDGNTAIIGAMLDDNLGSAYVFGRVGTAWTQQAKITAGDRVENARFGFSVAIAGETAVVGADKQEGGKGAAYVFARNGIVWTQQAKLAASDQTVLTQFGSSVAVLGSTVVVGAPAEAPFGATYVYILNRRPVFILPGIGATYATDVSNDLPWLIHRGVEPSMMQIDPLARTYHDLIKTLENAGYQQGKDLFVVNYDWRVTPGPDDGAIDGRVAGLTAASISANVYRYGVDYLGDALKRAAERWTLDHPLAPPLDAVDVIAHSTGGLVARTYIQSDAYGGVYAGTKTLPKINNLVMIGVPNRGASKPWNPLQDNWVVDPAFEFVLAKIVNRAYQKVLNGAVIAGPDRNISLASLSPPACTELPEVCFINQYVPTIRSLLATYNFIDFGAGFTNVNASPAIRNSLMLDLNAGLDLNLVGDPNAFGAATLVKPTVIYGTNGGAALAPLPGLRSGTPTSVVARLGPASDTFSFLSIANFSEAGPRNADPGETWYRDNLIESSGDGTVPLDSSRDQFVGDTRFVLKPFTQGSNTSGSVGHTDLPSNADVQLQVLGILGATCAPPCQISTGLGGAVPKAAACAATGCVNFTLDPVEGFMVDRLGRRLGYTAATGAVTEIPNSVWYGNTDGMGWVFGAVEEPLTMELTGLGGHYYANVALLGANGRTGAIVQGTLGVGERRSVPVPLSSNAPTLYTVTPSAGPNGTITPSVPQTVQSGDVVTFTLAPSQGLAATLTGTCGGRLVNNIFTTDPISSDCTVIATFGASIALLSVQSRKAHGGAGSFDLPVSLNVPINGAVTVEPRGIGTGHSMVFRFDNLVATVGAVTVVDALMATVGNATVTPSGNDVIVTLTNVADNKRVTVSLEGVNGSGAATASLGFLVGDVNNSRSVNASDISAVKARSGQTTSAANFRFDVNASGAINASDISAVKARSGLSLP